MKHKVGVVFMILGAVMLLGALGLHFWNRYEAQQAKRSVEYFLPIMLEAISDNALKNQAGAQQPQDPSQEGETLPVDPDYYDPEMVVTEIEGYGFIGYVSIPERGLLQPVLSETDKQRLKVAPCRYRGSTKTDDLIIGGHNNTGHFAPLHKVQIDDEVLFTDMEGKVWKYRVVLIETLKTSDGEKLVSGDYDLTLYTCAYDTRKRVTVRCERIEDVT